MVFWDFSRVFWWLGGVLIWDILGHFGTSWDILHAQFYVHFLLFVLLTMATYKIYPDVRRRKKDGTAPVKLVLHHQGSQRYISIGMYVNPDDWDSATGKVKTCNPLHRQLNLRIGQLRLAADEVLLGIPPLCSMVETADILSRALFPERHQEEEAAAAPKVLRLVDVARRFAALKAQKSTRDTYERTITHLERFRPEARLEDVNQAWLQEFDAHMAQRAPSPNARAIHMRNLRAVFNFAIDEELTQNYPFRRYKITTVATAKRSLSAEQLRRLLTMEVDEWQQPYRDFFALSFFLIGTNAKDILHLPAMADKGGRIEFNRAKTKKLYSILVQPEAAEIIERYRGVRYMLNILDDRSDYVQYIRQCNHALKLIGTRSRKGCSPTGSPLFPYISTYYARHSWATIAAELDIPKETIAAALGHDMGNRTTAIYINFNQAKVDEANRRVIDYVLGGA